MMNSSKLQFLNLHLSQIMSRYGTTIYNVTECIIFAYKQCTRSFFRAIAYAICHLWHMPIHRCNRWMARLAGRPCLFICPHGSRSPHRALPPSSASISQKGGTTLAEKDVVSVAFRQTARRWAGGKERRGLERKKEPLEQRVEGRERENEEGVCV